jgi:uncharacterized damage-inducible protein DinB
MRILFPLLILLCWPPAPAHAQDPLLKRYTAYNVWADQALADWLATATDAQWEQEIPSSFTTLRRTALHIWSAEYLWLQVLRDEPYTDNPTRDFRGSNADLLAGWREASEAFHRHVDGMSDEDLSGTRGGGDGRAPLRVDDIIQHCMNHSTYHRGQLITQGRQAGLADPPRSDYIHFVGR